jgi:hypothetical protein
MLHITNGDSTVGIMREAQITGEILPWRDVLHEGPTPAGLALEDMTKVRARFIADCGWAAFDESWSQFRERDAALARFRDHTEVILWFEHDLYDQLQLLQLLDYFSRRDLGETTLSMICVDEYLGLVTPARMAALEGLKRPVTDEQLKLGNRGWTLFCAPDPSDWNGLVREDTSALPFLAGAVIRHLEQYPSAANGLNRTETSMLETVRSGIRPPGRIFAAVQETEERQFMGDSTFWIYMKGLMASRPRLLKTSSGKAFIFPTGYPYSTEFTIQEILLAEAGSKVLQNDLDWVRINGIDKWLGGVHLQPGHFWRWEGSEQRLVNAGRVP